MGLMKELNDLNNIYQNMYAEDENKGYVVTAADKKGNTPAWQGYKAGKKKKDGKPMYRAADHLKTEGYEDVEEGVYEKIKKKEILAGMTKKGIKISKRDKEKIADKVVALKGDTSKSDDRYAYESKLWDEVAENLTQLGELNDADFRVEGYQRNPERDTRSARERRMDDPDRGINSQAFRDFMAAQQRPSKPKKKAEKK